MPRLAPGIKAVTPRHYLDSPLIALDAKLRDITKLEKATLERRKETSMVQSSGPGLAWSEQTVKVESSDHREMAYHLASQTSRDM